MAEQLTSGKKRLVADWETLNRIFIHPEDDASRRALLKYMQQILFGLHDFLKAHVGITEEVSLKKLAQRFTDTRISEQPQKKLAEVISDIVNQVAPHAVNVASPYFVGHMASAIPYFMVHLKTLTAALNQNVVKIETSKAVSMMEKQVLAQIHRLVFIQPQAFYDTHVQSPVTTLGNFTEDGTLANITALWVARNGLLAPQGDFEGCEASGVAAGLQAHQMDRAVILVSRLGHYSLRKAAGVLGIGHQNVVAIDVDRHNRMDLTALQQTLAQIKDTRGRTRVVALVGIAGATETGSIDPLLEMARICQAEDIHFHVDAAWGGPTLLSKKYRHLLAGIEAADSVTIDGHKQFYMPMGCGMVLFRDPHAMERVAYHARYIARPGSVDLGIKSLAGSREASSIVLGSSLQIMGSQGFALLIEHGIETARAFAQEIRQRPLFELVSAPVLNILTYRICPPAFKDELATHEVDRIRHTNQALNDINRRIQVLQREAGKSFVSRTTLFPAEAQGDPVIVLRSVIMNPLTDLNILKEILDEQAQLYAAHF